MPAPPLEECLDGFWSPGLSPARLRALATAPDAAAPDLLLRMFPPPPVTVRRQDLADVLAPAYQRLAADDAPGAAASADDVGRDPAWAGRLRSCLELAASAILESRLIVLGFRLKT